MSKKKLAVTDAAISIPRENYDRMVDTMLELAYRGEMQEGLMMRAAKAGGIAEVTKEIARRRMYAKKQGMVRQSRADVQPIAPGKKKAARKKKAAAHTAPSDAGEQHEHAHDVGSGAGVL